MSVAVCVFLLFLAAGFGPSKAAFISANPSTIFPTTTKTLTIECNIRPLLAAIKDVYVLQIDKTVNGQTVSLASVTEHGVVADSGFQGSRMNVSGELVTATGRGPFIKLVLQDPDIGDKGTYFCSASTTDKTGTLVNLSYQTIVDAADSVTDELMRIVSNLTQEIFDLREENKILQDNFTDYQNRLQDLENVKPCNCSSTAASGSTISANQMAQITQRLDELAGNFTQDLMTYNARLAGLDSEVDQLRINQSGLSVDVTRFGQTAQRLVLDMAYTSTKYTQIENRVKVVENISTEQYSEIAKISNDRKGLAFSYTYPDIDQSSGVLYFRYKLTDSVPSYDSQNGVFTAPRDGLYLLSLHIATTDGSLEIAIKVKQDLVAHAVTSFSNGIQQGSTTTVVRMSKGDSASVKIAKILVSPVNLEKGACSFSGVFLGPS